MQWVASQQVEATTHCRLTKYIRVNCAMDGIKEVEATTHGD